MAADNNGSDFKNLADQINGAHVALMMAIRALQSQSHYDHLAFTGLIAALQVDAEEAADMPGSESALSEELALSRFRQVLQSLCAPPIPQIFDGMRPRPRPPS